MKPPKITNMDMYIHFCEGEKYVANPQFDKAMSCSRKKNFLSMEAAQTEADNQTRIQKEPFVAYKCRWCKFHHIGHRQS
jgi:hypothetical protein